ncbi:hypothetical protein D7X94_16165 [Acutalibacter sp. 1XD8-33]|uniref:hypothetical protein n=1 Tax=Acutalibacter sp. 1XD8-33 TaxID=2320081 RepID=UPI000EA1AD42|nr:hypothetical protein [Acutalibacter sp. 1XD8-33]RKJ38501.1 hypothetical protein D7X94_16165 [Acutalibacter sp. 1XD8-33]
MLDKRGRDIGEPTGEVFYEPATPESVARNRDNIPANKEMEMRQFVQGVLALMKEKMPTDAVRATPVD